MVQIFKERVAKLRLHSELGIYKKQVHFENSSEPRSFWHHRIWESQNGHTQINARIRATHGQNKLGDMQAKPKKLKPLKITLGIQEEPIQVKPV